MSEFKSFLVFVILLAAWVVAGLVSARIDSSSPLWAVTLLTCWTWIGMMD